MKVKIELVVSRLRCWWLGCEPHPQDPAPPDFLECQHCGEIVDYGDLVGDTRYNRFKAWCYYWLFRRWCPVKCGDCGRRWRDCDDAIDHIPF